MGTKIDSKTARERLKPRREPYWHKVRDGLHLGYRRIESGEGTWIGRSTTSTKKTYRALGQFSDSPGRPAFEAATKALKGWSDGADAGIEDFDTIVEGACKAYVTARRTEKGDANADDADGRFRRLVYGTSFGTIRLDKLTPAKVRAWRDAQVPSGVDEDTSRRAKDSANRNLATLKAALNLALRDRLVQSDAGWKSIDKFSDVGRRRELFLDRAQRAALLDACPSGLREIVEGLMLTALRPGELAAATVDDFDKKHGTLNVRKSKTKARIVPLSTAAINYFKTLSRDRIGEHPVVADEFGAAWDKDKWKKPFKEAARAAKLPGSAVLYSLRHAAISELLVGGMDMHTVAKIAGTSTEMIDQHYGHLCVERTRAQLDAANIR